MEMILTETTPDLEILAHPKMTVGEFFTFCGANPDWRLELTTEGKVEVMPPTGYRTGRRNAGINAHLYFWAQEDGRGRICDSSSGFRLPNGAVRSPDASWILHSRAAAFTPEEWEKALPLCPDFVIELISPSDRLTRVKAKMQEYLDNGAQLGWLIDANARTAYIYRPNRPVEQLIAPDRLAGESTVDGFILEMAEIWDPE